MNKERTCVFYYVLQALVKHTYSPMKNKLQTNFKSYGNIKEQNIQPTEYENK